MFLKNEIKKKFLIYKMKTTILSFFVCLLFATISLNLTTQII